MYKKEKHTQKRIMQLKFTITKKWNKHRGIKEFLQKLYWHNGKDVTMPCSTQTTEVLLGWKCVRQAVGRALYTLEQFTIGEAEIFRYTTNTCKGTKTKTSYFTKKNINSVDLFIYLLLMLLIYWVMVLYHTRDTKQPTCHRPLSLKIAFFIKFPNLK